MDDPLDPSAWIARAEEDFALAQSALRRKTPLTYGTTFHAQQCIEKYLKALLIIRHFLFPRTHDLVALAELCGRADIILPVEMDELERLNAFSVQVRYPGIRPTVEEAQETLQMARILRRFCRKNLGLSK